MITRRALGAGALATALGAVGCAPAVQAPSAAPGTPVSPPSPVADRPSSTPPASPSATPSPTPTGPDPDEVARRFAKKNPTGWGMDLPGIVSWLDEPKEADGRMRVALTLDACGGKHGSGFDERLISGLVDRGVPATLFVNLRWIDANPGVMKELLAEPQFELGNHGTRHIPLSVTGREAYGIAGSASAREAVDEVWGCHERLAELVGTPPRFFRSGTAHYDDVGVAIALALGETPVGFSTNGDAGATYPAATVRSEVRSAKPGGIVIAHFNRPDSGTAKGMLSAVDDLLAEGVEFVHPIHHN